MDVSVVVPVGSIDVVLHEQLGRVLHQEIDASIDVVLSVNSPSSDVHAEVSAIVEDLSDDRVRTVDSSDRRGAAHARNVGARSSACEIIAFCDADDLVHDGWLEALVRGLERHDAVSGRTLDVFPEARMAAWYPVAERDGLNRFLNQPYLLSGNLAIKRHAFDAVGGFDEELTRCEDIAISWSLVRNGYSIGYVADAVIDYRRRPGVLPMLHQHYLFGRGMSEVLRRFGTPSDSGWSDSAGIAVLRPNGQARARRTFVGSMRRGAIAAGRVRGLITVPATRFGDDRDDER